jgi:hypothetical protein
MWYGHWALVSLDGTTAIWITIDLFQYFAIPKGREGVLKTVREGR